MNPTIIVAVLSLMGTLIGTFGGIIAANKLTAYRIQELEKKVEKHNTVIERTFILERDMKTAFNYIKDAREDIKDLQEQINDVRGRE